VQATHSQLAPVTHGAYGSGWAALRIPPVLAGSLVLLALTYSDPETLPLWPTGASSRWTSH